MSTFTIVLVQFTRVYDGLVDGGDTSGRNLPGVGVKLRSALYHPCWRPTVHAKGIRQNIVSQQPSKSRQCFLTKSHRAGSHWKFHRGRESVHAIGCPVAGRPALLGHRTVASALGLPSAGWIQRSASEPPPHLQNQSLKDPVLTISREECLFGQFFFFFFFTVNLP